MERKEIQDDFLKKHLGFVAPDEIQIFMLEDGTVRGAVVHATQMINEMRNNHELGILETLALGQTYIALALISTNLKDKGKIQLDIDCDGPVQGISAEVNQKGQVRGYLKQVPIPVEAPPESFDLAPFIGEGTLRMTRYLADNTPPFTGTTQLQKGRIAYDLAHYYLTSEQKKTAFSLSIKFDTEGKVIGAGGIFLQPMPAADDELRLDLEDWLAEIPSLGEYFSQGNSASEVMTDLFRAFKPELLETKPVSFECTCSHGRFARFLASMSIEELEEIYKKGPFPVETRCWNCNTAYNFTKNEIGILYTTKNRQ